MKEFVELVFEIAKVFGIPAVAIGFFIWQGHKREQRLAARLDGVEDYIRETLQGLVRDGHAAVMANTGMMEDFTAALKTRPCIKADVEMLEARRKPGG